jgi:hypothetical protein
MFKCAIGAWEYPALLTKELPLTRTGELSEACPVQSLITPEGGKTATLDCLQAGSLDQIDRG